MFVYSHVTGEALSSFWRRLITLCLRAQTAEQCWLKPALWREETQRERFGPLLHCLSRSQSRPNIFKPKIIWEVLDVRCVNWPWHQAAVTGWLNSHRRRAEWVDGCRKFYWLTWKSMRWLSWCHSEIHTLRGSVSMCETESVCLFCLEPSSFLSSSLWPSVGSECLSSIDLFSLSDVKL